MALTTEERIRVIRIHQEDPALSDAERLDLLDRDVDYLVDTLEHLLGFLRRLEDWSAPGQLAENVLAFPGKVLRR